jgi:glycosyltransferase involved in cell wall biosynthesis
MKIAYICADPGIPVFGNKGGSIHVQEVLRAFLKRGAQIDLFATAIGGDPPADLQTVRLRELPPAPKGDAERRERLSLDANRYIRAGLERHGPYDLVYERYSLWSFAGIEWAQKSNTPSVLEVNSPLIEEQAKHRELADRAAVEKVATQIFSAARVVITVSDEVGNYVKGFSGAEGRVHVVPNGVNTDRFPDNLKGTIPAGPGTFTIGFVGSFRPWHGIPILIDAFAQLHARQPDTRLLIVGDGPEREKLTADVIKRGLKKDVRFVGEVNPTLIPELLASMDVAVAPYPSLENFYFSPLKVFEYMAAGRAVVASRIGQLEKVIRSGEDGLLVTPGDAAALGDALERLSNDESLRKRLGQNARQKILREHTWDAVADRILRLAGVASE